MQCALDALVAVVVDRRHDLEQQWRCRRDVEAIVEGDHVVDQRPRSAACARADLVPQGHQRRLGGLGLTEAVDEVEPRR